MKRVQDEAEFLARGEYNSKTLYLSVSCWPKMARKFEARYGKPKTIWKDRDGEVTSAFWEIPLRCLSFRGLAKKKTSSGAKRTPPKRKGKK